MLAFPSPQPAGFMVRSPLAVTPKQPWERTDRTRKPQTLLSLRTAAVAGAVIALRAKRSSLGAMSELLLNLRVANEKQRNEMLRKEDEKGLRAICAGLGQPSTGPSESALERIQEALKMEDALYQGPAARVIQVSGQVKETDGDVASLLQERYRVHDLKSICRTFGLSQGGKKQVLAERIATKALELWQVMKSRGLAEKAPPSSANGTVQDAGSESPSQSSPAPRAQRRARPAEVQEIMEDAGRSTQTPRQASPAQRAQRRARPAEVQEIMEDAGKSTQTPRQASPAQRARSRTIEIKVEPAGGPGGSARAKKTTATPSQASAEWDRLSQPVQVEQRGPTPSLQQRCINEAREIMGKDKEGAVIHEAEIVPEEDDEDEEDEQSRKERRYVQRRTKLVSYVAEESSEVYGDHQQQYLADLSDYIADASDDVRFDYLNDKLEAGSEVDQERLPKVLGPARDTPEYSAWHVEPYKEEMHLVGEMGPSRVAYCKWWDRAAGCGELVDRDDKRPVAVVAAALTTGANVTPTAKYLAQGEWVEYRRVPDAEIDRGILVRGVRGWPLQCEADGSRALPS
ncbi:unnamed protein product [Durusdinium trenchii]|uniref:SAP domain-containing protein n=1 Tax=Durusdinium trenchii TaxID=1381693 RepID=A0ABP0JBL3_9DINO